MKSSFFVDRSMPTCEPERRHVSQLNPLYDAWSTVIFSYLPGGFFPKNKNTALRLRLPQ